MPGVDQMMSCLILAGLVVIFVNLGRFQLLPLYRFFSFYLAVLSLEIALLLVTPFSSDRYAYIYFVFQSLNLLVACGVVGEIYQLALANHPALASFGRTVVIWAILIAGGITAVASSLDSQILPGQSPAVHRFFTIERSGNFIMLLLLMMVSVYLTWFPVTLQRNVVVYAAGFAVFFFARASGILAINLFPQSRLLTINNIALLLELLCIGFWVWGFKRVKEDEPTVTGHRWNPAEIGRLTKQLDSINIALERFRRT